MGSCPGTDIDPKNPCSYTHIRDIPKKKFFLEEKGKGFTRLLACRYICCRGKSLYSSAHSYFTDLKPGGLDVIHVIQ